MTLLVKFFEGELLSEHLHAFARKSYNNYLLLKTLRIVLFPLAAVYHALLLVLLMLYFAVYHGGRALWEIVMVLVGSCVEYYTRLFRKNYFGNFSRAYWQGLVDGTLNTAVRRKS